MDTKDANLSVRTKTCLKNTHRRKKACVYAFGKMKIESEIFR